MVEFTQIRIKCRQRDTPVAELIHRPGALGQAFQNADQSRPQARAIGKLLGKLLLLPIVGQFPMQQQPTPHPQWNLRGQRLDPIPVISQPMCIIH